MVSSQPAVYCKDVHLLSIMFETVHAAGAVRDLGVLITMRACA